MERLSLGLLTAVALATPILSAIVGMAGGIVLLSVMPRFFVLGMLAGAIDVTIGAVGPLIAPLFLNLGLPRQGILGTEAACQALGHVAKLAVFGAAGFAFPRFASSLALLAAAVVLGTWIGSRILGYASEVAFTWLFEGVLTLVGLRLVGVDGLGLP